MSRAEPLPALTGLRFFAALHVVVFHFGGGWMEGAPGWVQAIYQCGYASVGLFFVLSGFVLSYNLPFALLHNALLAPVYALLVYGLARGGGGLGWLLSRPSLVRLGEASYALYILHHPVWVAAGAVAAAAAPWVELRSPRPLFAVFLPGVLAVSLLSHRYVELPLRGWVRRVLQSWAERSRRGAAVAPEA